MDPSARGVIWVVAPMECQVPPGRTRLARAKVNARFWRLNLLSAHHNHPRSAGVVQGNSCDRFRIGILPEDRLPQKQGGGAQFETDILTGFSATLPLQHVRAHVD